MKKKEIGYLFVFSLFFLLAVPVKAFFGKPIKKAIRFDRGIRKKIRPTGRESKPMIEKVGLEKVNQLKGRVLEKKKDVSERIKVRREKFKEKIKKIKNERKRRIVEKVNQRLNVLNKRIAAKMSQYLDHLEAILTKVEARKERMKARGVDVSAAEAKIAAIKRSITAAREVIRTQASKDYTPEIQTEDKLRLNVGQSYQNLRNDLKVARQTIVKVRKEMIDLLNLLASLGSNK